MEEKKNPVLRIYYVLGKMFLFSPNLRKTPRVFLSFYRIKKKKKV